MKEIENLETSTNLKNSYKRAIQNPTDFNEISDDFFDVKMKQFLQTVDEEILGVVG